MLEATSHAPESADPDRPEPAAVESSSLEALAYVSSATPALGERELEALLRSARDRNVEHGISGVLLYHDGSFFQYLEGPRAGVDRVWEHIRHSRQHRGILVLMRAPIVRRAFPGWSMGFTRAPTSFLLQLANASWHHQLTTLEASGRKSDGMSLLLHFWSTSRAYDLD